MFVINFVGVIAGKSTSPISLISFLSDWCSIDKFKHVDEIQHISPESSGKSLSTPSIHDTVEPNDADKSGDTVEVKDAD